MNEPVSLILVGIGGYGEVYLSALGEEVRRGRCRLAAAVDPEPERCSRLAELRSQGVPVFASMDELPPPTGQAELTVISSPIHLHCPHTCRALGRGSHVLCEKPAAATVQEVDEMIKARDRAGRFVGIGYQWSFSRPIQELKRDILAGLFGRPRRLKSLCLWPRDASYYGRNNWAGRLRDGRGRWVLDSPANNAMAHDLHNMLYVLGDRMDASARPAEVTAEVYRANRIETFDTAAVRVRTVGGVEVLFLGSHAVRENMDPVFSFEFDDAVVSFAGGQSPIVARFRTRMSASQCECAGLAPAISRCHTGMGEGAKEYASPLSDPQAAKMSICLDAITGGGAIACGGSIPCGLEAAKSQTICVNGIHESMTEATTFPADFVGETGEGPKHLFYVETLPAILRTCFDRGVLPSESGVSWAQHGRPVDTRDYAWYPGGQRPA